MVKASYIRPGRPLMRTLSNPDMIPLEGVLALSHRPHEPMRCHMQHQAHTPNPTTSSKSAEGRDPILGAFTLDLQVLKVPSVQRWVLIHALAKDGLTKHNLPFYISPAYWKLPRARCISHRPTERPQSSASNCPEHDNCKYPESSCPGNDRMMTPAGQKAERMNWTKHDLKIRKQS